MRNLLRLIKNQFRYPKVGEIWALDEIGRAPYLYIVKQAVSWGYKGNIVLESIFVNSEGEKFTWVGQVHEAGPIYRVKANLRKDMGKFKWW